jgi:nitroreductase
MSTPSESLKQALQWRYATKRFDPSRSIPAEIWSALEQALILAPSSFGLQPWKFLVVTAPDVRRALVPQSWGQTQPVESSHFVVFAARTTVTVDYIDHFLARTVELRGGTVEALAGYRGMMVNSLTHRSEAELTQWATHQVYIALGQFMAAAAVLGVDTCPMEGLVPTEYDKILGLEGSGYKTVVACAAGHRSPEDKYATLAKVRFPASELVRTI